MIINICLIKKRNVADVIDDVDNDGDDDLG